MEQSLVTLANRSGLLAAAFSPVGLAVTGIVAALGSFAVAAEQG
jgi:phage-related minor tail protein